MEEGTPIEATRHGGHGRGGVAQSWNVFYVVRIGLKVNFFNDSSF